MKISKILILLLIFYSYSHSQNFELIWSEPYNLIQLNSPNNDFAPQWNKYNKQLYFNSQRNGKTEFYYTLLDTNNQFQSPIYSNNGLNTSDNNCYITFLNETEAYISSFQMYSRRAYQNIFQLFEQRNQWSKPVFIESLGFEGFVSHPTISPDGKILIFSTNRDSKNKDLDLWMAFRQENGVFSSLQPIKELNTIFDEITPFLLSNDTLFFASNGQEGPGGFDCYYSIFKEGIWTKPVPLTAINTKYDESDFIILPDGNAVFASNRPGGKGQLDLYFVNIKKHKIEKSPILPDIEQSIACQVSSIKINYDIIYTTFIINPYVFESNSKYYLDSIFNAPKIDTNEIKPNLENIHYNILNIIGSRLKDNISSLLTIKINKNFDNKIGEDIKENLVEKWNISPTRILIQKEEFDSKNSILIAFESNDKNILAPMLVGKSEFNFEPKFLEVLLNARPVNAVQSWDFYFSNQKKLLIDKGRTLPYQLNIDLSNYSHSLLNLDSLTLEFIIKDINNQPTSFKSIINISQSENRRKDLIKLNNKYYELLKIYHPNNYFKESDFSNSLIKIISDNSKINNPIKIQYFNSKLKTVIEELIIDLNNKLAFKKLKISPEFISNDKLNNFEKDIINFLIEKGDF